MTFTVHQRPATQQEVLEGFVALLQAEFTDWDSSAIYWTDTENSETSTNLSRFITVYAGGGTFDQGALVGGVVNEDAIVAVKIWNRSELDNTGRSVKSLFQADDGLMPIKRRILKALTSKMLIGDDDMHIAIETLKPQSAGEPSTGGMDSQLDTLALSFAVKFEWDLS